ncbi:MAG: AI-2E family transporter [Chloroflexi bacterium]|nr:AI-2E family transporter [Chloroflexota bacterium]
MRSEALGWVTRGAGATLGVAAVLLLLALLYAAHDVLILVFLAVLLGAALEPVVAWIRARTGVPRGPAILIVYAAFLAAVVAVAVFVVPTALVQLSAALDRLPAFLDRLREWSERLRPESVAAGVGSVIDALRAPFRPAPPPDPESVLGASILVGSVGTALVTLLALVYFWLTERPRLQRYALAFLPAHRREGVRDAWNEVETRLGLWARGQLVLMATIGVATGVAYTVLGLPAALLLALVAAVTEIIPIVGPIIGAIPALLVATTVSPETAVLTLGVYVLLHALEGNVLVPIVMRNTVGLSPFLVLVSLLIGGTAGGILGAIVAVPIAAGVTAVLERLQARRTPVPVDPTVLERQPEGIEAGEATAAGAPPDAPSRKRRSMPRLAGEG